MKIWIADFTFDTTVKIKKVVKDVVTIRIPKSHIHRHSEFFDRAIRDYSITELKTLAKDKRGRLIASVNYTKIIGESQYDALE